MESMEYCIFESRHIPLMERFRDDQQTRYHPEQLFSFLGDANNRAFIALSDGQIVGFAYGYILQKPDGRKDFYLHAVDVMEEWQGKGCGTALISFIREQLHAMGCGKMFLITNRSNLPACKCYENAGGVSTSADDIVYIFR